MIFFTEAVRRSVSENRIRLTQVFVVKIETNEFWPTQNIRIQEAAEYQIMCEQISSMYPRHLALAAAWPEWKNAQLNAVFRR